MGQVKAFYPALLDKPFDFSKDQKINVDYEHAKYAASLTELKDVWRSFKVQCIGHLCGLKRTRRRQFSQRLDLCC